MRLLAIIAIIFILITGCISTSTPTSTPEKTGPSATVKHSFNDNKVYVEVTNNLDYHTPFDVEVGFYDGDIKISSDIAHVPGLDSHETGRGSVYIPPSSDNYKISAVAAYIDGQQHATTFEVKKVDYRD